MKPVFIRDLYANARRKLLMRICADYRAHCRKAARANYNRWAVYTVID